MRKILVTLLIVVAGLSTLTAQKTSSKFKPEGKWQFEAPSAPEGYTFGSMEVTFADKKYAALMGLPGGGDYKLPGDQVKFENGELTFKLYIEGEEILISLKPEGNDKMTGKAVYSGGDIPLTCNRDKEKK
jgi:hypothetical protein